MTTGHVIRIVDPAAETESHSHALAPRLRSLEGAKVAVIHNTKHMGKPFLDAVMRLLTERYRVAGFEFYRKANAGVATPREVIERLATSCNAVIHGVAD